MSDREVRSACEDLINSYRPFEKCDDRRLKEAIDTVTRFGRFMMTPDQIKVQTDEVKAILAARHKRAVEGPSFTSNERVQVIEDILWWNKATSAKPEVGVIGTVLSPSVPLQERYYKDDYDYTGLTPVRFLATDLGYEWEEGDDEDWKYITYNMPNYSLERIG